MRKFTIVIEWEGIDDELRRYGDGTEITVVARSNAAAIREARNIFTASDGALWNLTIIDAKTVVDAYAEIE